LHLQLAQEFLDQVAMRSPSFFERLVVDLLVHMGYGGSRKDSAQAIGKAGDGGIDGLIRRIAWAWTRSTYRQSVGKAQ
jgi:restriction system protein